MTNKEQPFEYFNSQNRAEAKVREFASLIDEAEELLDYVNSNDAVRYSLDGPKISGGPLFVIYYANGTSKAYRPVIRANLGLVVKDSEGEDGLLIRGSIYAIDINDINDKVALSAIQTVFKTSNLPCSNTKSPHCSVPFVAAKGQLGVGGYMAYNSLYTNDTFESMRRDGTITDTSCYKTIPHPSLKDYVMDERIDYLPYPINDVAILAYSEPEST